MEGESPVDGQIVYSTVRRPSATVPRGRILDTFNGIRRVDDNGGAILQQLVVLANCSGRDHVGHLRNLR